MTSQLSRTNPPNIIQQALSSSKNDTCCMCSIKFSSKLGPFPHEPIYVKDDLIWRCEPCSVADPKGKGLLKVLIAKGYQDVY